MAANCSKNVEFGLYDLKTPPNSKFLPENAKTMEISSFLKKSKMAAIKKWPLVALQVSK